jgi:hypothetical protein
VCPLLAEFVPQVVGLVLEFPVLVSEFLHRSRGGILSLRAGLKVLDEIDVPVHDVAPHVALGDQLRCSQSPRPRAQGPGQEPFGRGLDRGPVGFLVAWSASHHRGRVTFCGSGNAAPTPRPRLLLALRCCRNHELSPPRAGQSCYLLSRCEFLARLVEFE